MRLGGAMYSCGLEKPSETRSGDSAFRRCCGLRRSYVVDEQRAMPLPMRCFALAVSGHGGWPHSDGRRSLPPDCSLHTRAMLHNALATNSD